MFEKLVVSAVQRRKHTTAKFFAGTVMLYAITIVCGFIVSVAVSDPKLADTRNVLTLVGPPLLSGGTPPSTPTVRHPPERDTRPDPNHPMDLDTLLRQQHNGPPRLTPFLDHEPDSPAGKRISALAA